MAPESWLLLTYHLPTSRSQGRVQAWRRLKELGALQLRNAIHVLPALDRCREDFDWVRRGVRAAGGEATVFEGRPVDAAEGQRLVRLFRRAASDEYRALARAIDRVRRAEQRRAGGGVRRAGFRRSMAALKLRLERVRRADFFDIPEGRRVIAELAALDAPDPPPASGAARPARGAAEFQARRWVTRPRPGVDRMASAWLIRRHIDPAAAFAFVERPEDGDVPFDMHEGEFTHDGPMCTFETLAHRFGVRDGAVQRLAKVVHDLDFKDDRFRLAETAAVGRLIDGLRAAYRDDHVLLDQGIALFEALASTCAGSSRV